MFLEDLLKQLYDESIDPALQPQIADLISALVTERDDAIQKRSIDLIQQQRQIERMRQIAGIDDLVGPCELVTLLTAARAHK